MATNRLRLSVGAGASSTALEARRGNSRIVISTHAGSNPLQLVNFDYPMMDNILKITDENGSDFFCKNSS
jgi:hypothetical protein